MISEEPCALVDIADVELSKMTGRTLHEMAVLMGVKTDHKRPRLFPLVPENEKFSNYLEISFGAPPVRLVQRDVVTKLHAIKFDMTDIRFADHLAVTLEPHMNVKPLRKSEHPHRFFTPTIDLRGEADIFRHDETDEQIVTKARNLLIKLITHEIDEVLFVAGLGPDPHASKS